MRAAAANQWTQVEWKIRPEDPRWSRPFLTRGTDVAPPSRLSPGDRG
jgi:hypothetical protein